MFSTRKVKQAAWKFLDFLFTKQPRVEFTTSEGFLPTTQAEATDKYFTENTRLKVFVDLLPSAHFAPTVSLDGRTRRKRSAMPCNRCISTRPNRQRR